MRSVYRLWLERLFVGGVMIKRVVVFLLLMLLLVSSVFSLDMLSAEFAVEIGWLPQGVFNMYTSR